MKRARTLAITVAAMLAVAAGAPALAAAQTADSKPAIDTGAVNALNRMGDYLRALKAFQLTADVTTEEVMPDGQKIQLASAVNMIAERPEHLRAEVTSDRKNRLFYYDGKTFTLFAPRSGMYATVPAPPTIAELADRLETNFDIEVPFVDLFRWGTAQSNVKDITGAIDIGPAVVDGTTCEHYAFRQEGIDWQIWIQNGEFPLPRKLVITTLTDEARPQHESIYTWNLAPSVSADAFAFTPPKGATKIAIVDVAQAREILKKSKSGGSQ
jgi:hypothetical protein